MKIGDVWRDPVWSKVISAGILAAITSVGAVALPVLGTPIALPVWAIILAFLGVSATFSVIGWYTHEPDTGPPTIGLVGVTIFSGDSTLGYPLKVYVEMRNDSPFAINVHVHGFTPGVITPKRALVDVLQLRFSDYHPKDHGVGNIAVAPNQIFRVWMAADETRFNKDQLEVARGQIGKLLLRVNGQQVLIPV